MINSDIDFASIRSSLSRLKSDHDVNGEQAPSPDEIFAPDQHANALDPFTSIVVGARGAGKSFWAGVLNTNETRETAANFYPNLGLDKLIVVNGYSSFLQKKLIDKFVPTGEEKEKAYDFWQASLIKAVAEKMAPDVAKNKVSYYMDKYADPEDVDDYFIELDKHLVAENKIALIIFDALDTVAREWQRSTLLLDALFEVVWSLRTRKNIKAKIFIRPEQLNDESLRFVEMPKLRSSRVELEWSQEELYGLLFSKLAFESKSKDFIKLCASLGFPINKPLLKKRKQWELSHSKEAQKKLMLSFAGPYMGTNYKKGGTYDWPYKHLSDANGKVTPRSFVKLFVEAAKHGQSSNTHVVTAEGIRHGLREASKVRVDQLGVEYAWVRRALAPLAGLRVPCEVEEIYARWRDTNTIKLIMNAAEDSESGFLPPFPPKIRTSKDAALLQSMSGIGLIEYRVDGRIDIPDLFRVAAKLLKKGGLAPTK